MSDLMAEIIVIGTPAPQGSKRHVGHGILKESSVKLAPWREAVTYAARHWMQQRGLSAPALSGPISYSMIFTLRRPKRPKYSVPATPPDISKLQRSTEDALTDAGIWEDDGRVVQAAAYKVFVGHEDALDVPGAVIRVWCK